MRGRFWLLLAAFVGIGLGGLQHFAVAVAAPAALGAVGDSEALQFEQSITMVNEMGVDYDQNPPDPIHKLNCRSDYFRR